MQQGYYAVIPATVRYSKKVKDGAKLLYGEITALCDKSGFCWAANSYFAELYDCSERTISRWISELAQAGFILTLVDNERGNSRKIWLTESQGGIDKNVHRVTTKMSQGYRQKCREGIDKSVYNNTTVNTTVEKGGGGGSARAKVNFGIDEFDAKDFDLKAEKKPSPPVPAAPPSMPPADGAPSIRPIQEISKSNEGVLNAYLVSRRLPLDRFDELMLAFEAEQKVKRTRHHSEGDYIEHFLNFSGNRIRIEKEQSARKPNHSQGPAAPLDPPIIRAKPTQY